ncbi:MAG: hypothetical protein HeimC3_40180 [Candidatus Heimdallarchaeota archaeon LC_3]|nr:MAG: hypothetical protein HeimC3_40180 [Candidatus Heimdallarchaeota archaeon LC_3]
MGKLRKKFSLKIFNYDGVSNDIGNYKFMMGIFAFFGILVAYANITYFLNQNDLFYLLEASIVLTVSLIQFFYILKLNRTQNYNELLALTYFTSMFIYFILLVFETQPSITFFILAYGVLTFFSFVWGVTTLALIISRRLYENEKKIHKYY